MAILDALYNELADLESARKLQVSQLKAMDEDITAAQVKLISEREHLNRNSVAANLPCDILSIIFQAGVEAQLTAGPQELWQQRPKQLPFEIVVSHMSHRWRTIALWTPGLWPCIYLNPCRSTIDLLKIYLERFGRHLLDINIRIPPYVDDQKLYQLFKAHFGLQLNTVIQHAARWRRLSIVLPVEFTQALSVLTEVSVPALESLLLGVQSRTRRITPNPVHLFTRGAPMLSSVELYGYSSKCFLPPLASATSLTLRGHTLRSRTPAQDFRTLYNHTLSQAQAGVLFSPLRCVTHLYLQAEQISFTFQDPIELPSVISLDLFLIKDGGIGAVNCLDLPALETLSLIINGTSHLPTFALSLRHKPYPALRTLKVLDNEPGYCLPAPMLDFVTAFPDVEELVFDYHLARGLVDALNAELADGLPWRRLHTIAVTAPTREPSRPETGLQSSIITLIDKRIASGHAIWHLTLPEHITGQMEQAQLEQLGKRVDLDISYVQMGASPSPYINPLQAWCEEANGE